MDMKKIVVAVDGSRLSRAALPVAADLQRHLGAEVVIATIGALPETTTQAEEEETDLESMLENARRRIGGNARTRVEPQGDPVAGILHVAADEHADLIVMTTHGRSGLSRLAHGSVCEGVVRESHIPVLLVPAATVAASAHR